MSILDQIKTKTSQSQGSIKTAFGQVKSAWNEAGQQQSKKVERELRKQQKSAETKRKPSATARGRYNRRRYGQTTDAVDSGAAANFVDVGAPAPETAPKPAWFERLGFERILPAASDPAEIPQPSAPHANRLHIDVPLLLVLITILVFGMLMVYSASADFSYATHKSSTYLFFRQLMFLGLGILATTVLAWMNYHTWQKLALPAMLVTLGSLFIVLFIGDQRHGAVRTLFNGSVQPSELAKVVTVIYLAVWLYSKRDVLHDVNFGLFPLGMILGLIGGFIWLQPDLSAVLTVLVIGGIMFFLANSDLKQISILMAVALVFGLLVVVSGGLTATGQDRVQSFLAGWSDPLQASYHVQRALEAFVKGGLFGVGIGNADTKFTGLPVPHTDSIFAVVGEETGLLGATGMVMLYSLLLWRGMVIAKRAPDGLGKLLAAGLSIWLALEAYINMAVMVGLMPFAGNALPFVSVGGSNLLMSMIAVGIILNVSRQSERSVEQKERTFSEVVDCAGGTGGGVYPALAVHHALTREHSNMETLWVGGEGGMEADLVKREGIPFEAIPAAGVHGVGLRSLPGNLARLGRGLAAARRILKARRPDVLLFTGGYVAVPMALAARLPGLGQRRPRSLLYIPDIEPGLALKTLIRFADHIAITSEASQRYLPRRKPVTVTGYPLRPELQTWTDASARQALGLASQTPPQPSPSETHGWRGSDREGCKVLLVSGGSKGARSINRALIANLKALLPEMEIIHISGQLDWPEVEIARTSLSPELAARYHPYPYLHEMGAAFTVADLVVSRAGASTLGEYPLFGLPAILVPYPYAWRYQKVNADYLAERGAAIVLENDALSDQLLPLIRKLMADNEQRAAMRQAMHSLHRPNASQAIASIAQHLGTA